jgi:membrane-bound serine protease (ClpP class)
MLTWILLLYFFGCFLIFLEVFLPGLICGVVGGCFVLLSAGLAMYAYPEHIPMIVVGETLGCALTVMVALFLFPRVPFSKKLVVQRSLDAKDGYVSNESDLTLMGIVAPVDAPLHPVGTITVDGKRVQAIARGQFIESGVNVRVVEVQGNRVVVEEAARN